MLPAAVHHRVLDDQFWCWLIESDPSASFSSFKRDIFLFTPWQCCVAFTASFGLHPR